MPCLEPWAGMKRRDFITFLGGATVWPLAAHAQRNVRMRRIGILMPYPPSNAEMQSRIRTFREELRKRGWASGINVQFDERWTTDNMELIRSAATNLVELKPDAIMAVGARVIPVLMQTTRSIPIVYPGGSDPVAQGYAASLARPGGNVTGFAVMELSVIGKMLQLLKEMSPNISRVLMIYDPDNPSAAAFVRSFEAATKSLGIEPIVSRIRGFGEIEMAVIAAAAQPNGGIFIPLDVTINALHEQTVRLVGRYGLPAIYSERIFVENGGLAYYGADRTEMFRGAASYIDRILRGEKPGDMPYQNPTKYEFVINRKTANALGLEIPPKLLFAADEVIE